MKGTLSIRKVNRTSEIDESNQLFHSGITATDPNETLRKNMAFGETPMDFRVLTADG